MIQSASSNRPPYFLQFLPRSPPPPNPKAAGVAAPVFMNSFLTHPPHKAFIKVVRSWAWKKFRQDAPPVPTRAPTSVASLVQDQPEPEDVDQHPDVSKKKNKVGKTCQEEEVLDQILAEIGAAPYANFCYSSRGKKVQDQPGPEEAADDKEGEEGRTRKVSSRREKTIKARKEAPDGEEARCLDARRKQVLASASFPLTPGESSGAAILDSVNSKNSREIPQEIVVELDSGEPENVEKVEFGTRKDKTEINSVLTTTMKSGMLNIEAKNARPAHQFVELPSAKSVSQNAGVWKRNSAAKGNDQKINKKNKKVNASEETSKAGDHSGQIEQNLRSPICCIMVMLILQIGVTYIPTENIRQRTRALETDTKLDVPGLLVINDTPGHKSFNNLRSRGSGLCDIAILIVDIMHGLKPQTIESLNLLRMRNTESLALNKVGDCVTLYP
ncbi:hypothetical protein ACS0TY_002008 [Phlomoides rotata]